MATHNSPAPTLVDDDASSGGAHSAASIPKVAPTASPANAGGSSPASVTKALETEEGPLYAGEGTEESPYAVKWLPGEPGNPQEWSSVRKYTIVASVAVSTLCVSFGSSVYAGGISDMIQYFHVSTEVITLGLSLYVLGFAVGPLLWAPFSELLGRRFIHIVTYSLFALFHIGAAAARNIETLLICRFFSGFFGSAPLTNSGGVIGDMFNANERALAMSCFAAAPFLGPVLGPIVGNFIGENTSWRWIFWVETIFSFVMYVIHALVPETYAPVLLRWKADKLSKETGRVYMSEFDLKAPKGETLVHKIKINLTRPFILLFRETICSLFALYAAVVYGTLYLLFGAFDIVWVEVRGWSPGLAGLPFIGVGVGMGLAIVINVFVNKKYGRDAAAAGGSLPPEARLPVCALGGAMLPIGLFWFAWTCGPSVHWIVPCLAVIPFGCGMVLVFLAMMNYLVDTYLFFAASALAANSVLRSIFGAVFPLFTTQMFDRLGYHWALTLVAFLSLMLVPIPVLFYIYGERIRANSAFAPGHKAAPPPKTQAEKDLAVEVAEADLAQEEDLELARSRSRASAAAQQKP
ncbi:hypothetical protein MNV49_002935 [Pseudohyphozyma bogoriensis]|nr:hypothetical protein MNV49_002935 [Pseudohyphozyma bogoriensis]